MSRALIHLVLLLKNAGIDRGGAMTDPRTGTSGDGADDDIELLLPWYAKGTLDPANRARVEAHLKRRPNLAVQLATIEEDLNTTVVANQAITHSNVQSWYRLAKKVEAEMPLQKQTRRTLSGTWQLIEDTLRSLAPGQLGWAAVTAAVVIVLQAGLIGNLLLQQPERGATYQTASGEHETSGTFVLVKFQDAASLNDISKFLSDNSFQIVSGPYSGNLYRLRLSPDVWNKDKADGLMRKLRARSDIITMAFGAKK